MEIGKFIGPAVLLFVVLGTNGQQNAIKNLSPSLLECYDGYGKWNLLPHNIETLIAIIRKIEDSPNLNMDLRSFSAALLHRFRQDGVVRNPKVKASEDIKPYAPLGQQFFRHAQTLRVIPGSAVTFPNDSISALERCTLHSMISSSIGIFERGDEARVCKVANYAYHHRYGRSVDSTDKGLKEEVETLTAEQLDLMTKGDIGADPNSQYPALPPNHPSSARLTQLPPRSRCPTENGVIKTPWGTVSGGSVLAGIAAGLEPQQIRVGDLMRSQVEQRVVSFSNEQSLDNKFLATLAGDLAEVALSQGPQQNDRYSLGADGNWNSTTEPLYYFLNTNDNLQMTAAEIRGDLDGLILASNIKKYYDSIRDLRLSQVLDMYYSNRGFFDKKVRACNRRSHYLTLAPAETLTAQTHSAAIVLSSGIATVTFLSEAIEKFSSYAVGNLSAFIPTMNSDKTCEVSERAVDLSEKFEPAVNLTIILDTTWEFITIKPVLAQLLAGVEVSKYNSHFSIINAVDGSFMVNSSNNIIDFYTTLNETTYNKLRGPFNLPRAMERLRYIQSTKLNEERRLGIAGGKSDVVLIIPYNSNISPGDKEFCYNTLKTMHEEAPDAVVLFLTAGSKDRWTDLVENRDTDAVSLPIISETTESNPAVDTILERIKQGPRRLINTRCGANYDESSDQSKPLIDFVGPNGVNFYRMHPNYFFSRDTDNPPRIKIQSTGPTPLKICTSNQLLHINARSAIDGADCASVAGNTHTIELKCKDDASYIHQCEPYYLSIASSSNNTGYYGCTDIRVCRFPDNIRYTISFENLVCKSGASALLVTPILLLTLLLAKFL